MKDFRPNDHGVLGVEFYTVLCAPTRISSPPTKPCLLIDLSLGVLLWNSASKNTVEKSTDFTFNQINIRWQHFL